jgi:hypothetical protein
VRGHVARRSMATQLSRRSELDGVLGIMKN